MATTSQPDAFFCLSCRVTGELDLHGRCATCGSDAVTHPLRYWLSFSEADDCCIRERTAPRAANLEDGEVGSLLSDTRRTFSSLRETNCDSNQKGEKKHKTITLRSSCIPILIWDYRNDSRSTKRSERAGHRFFYQGL